MMPQPSLPPAFILRPGQGQAGPVQDRLKAGAEADIENLNILEGSVTQVTHLFGTI